MHKEFLMGNAAIALGAVAAGVNVVAGYPGTPSTEVLETIAKHRRDQLYLHDGNIKKDRYGKDFKNCHASSISGKISSRFPFWT